MLEVSERLGQTRVQGQVCGLVWELSVVRSLDSWYGTGICRLGDEEAQSVKAGDVYVPLFGNIGAIHRKGLHWL